MTDYSMTALAAALVVDPGDVRAVLVDVDEDPLPGWAVTDVHHAFDAHGQRTVPKLHMPDALTGEWLTLGRGRGRVV